MSRRKLSIVLANDMAIIITVTLLTVYGRRIKIMLYFTIEREGRKWNESALPLRRRWDTAEIYLSLQRKGKDAALSEKSHVGI
jgi:hypothetical protein